MKVLLIMFQEPLAVLALPFLYLTVGAASIRPSTVSIFASTLSPKAAFSQGQLHPSRIRSCMTHKRILIALYHAHECGSLSYNQSGIICRFTARNSKHFS